MSQETAKRVRVEECDGVRVYSAGAWPGWGHVSGLVTVFGFLGLFVCGFLYGLHSFISGFEAVFERMEMPWLRGLIWIALGGIDLTVIGGFAFVCILIPYILLYDLSPKRFGIEGETLFHTSWLLGFIPHRRRIRFEQILDIEACKSTGGYALTVKYERDLPKWVFVILVVWNERLTQWAFQVVSGIPTEQEAQELQAALLEAMTCARVAK